MAGSELGCDGDLGDGVVEEDEGEKAEAGGEEEGEELAIGWGHPARPVTTAAGWSLPK